MSPGSTPPNIERQALVGASWLAIFRLASQLFSWTATIMVARMLDPADYGLMEMAMIIPGYAMKLSELGLGPAIIQRQSASQSQLSSVFWFSAFVAFLLSIICYASANLASWLFGEPRLITLTQVASIIFLLQSLQVVPSSLLRKRLDFKKVGQIEILAVVVSSATMLFVAHSGGGVWTLIIGLIALALAQLVFTTLVVKWRPSFHFNFNEVRQFLKFGMLISLQGTLFYVYDKSDKYFAGRAWQPSTLGQYILALQLAQLPSEKITVLINHVAFPTFSLLASDPERFRNFYLKTIKICAALVCPLFIGGFLVGSQIVGVLLSEKWAAIGPIFEYLCLAQILVSLNALNNFVHNAQGRVAWSSLNTTICAIVVPISFWLAVPYGLEAALIPWFTTYTVVSVVWIVVTIRSIGITPLQYIRNLSTPIAATLAMAGAISALEASSLLDSFSAMNLTIQLLLKVSVGAGTYLAYWWAFDDSIVEHLRSLRRP